MNFLTINEGIKYKKICFLLQKITIATIIAK